jgi:hypothetical protein
VIPSHVTATFDRHVTRDELRHDITIIRLLCAARVCIGLPISAQMYHLRPQIPEATRINMAYSIAKLCGK